jgi:hypothetical protein
MQVQLFPAHLLRNKPQHINHVMTLQEKHEDYLSSGISFLGCLCNHLIRATYIIESLLRSLGVTVGNYSGGVPNELHFLSTHAVESERITTSSDLS